MLIVPRVWAQIKGSDPAPEVAGRTPQTCPSVCPCRLPGSPAGPEGVSSPAPPDREKQPHSGEASQYGDHHSYLLKMRMEGGLEGIEIGPLLVCSSRV